MQFDLLSTDFRKKAFIVKLFSDKTTVGKETVFTRSLCLYYEIKIAIIISTSF